ncbi:phosphatidylserine decarboxylase-domain-containing protein [Tirmania nivea]|nr:phosphatidylserine decarboxylase-domain-containing protein [Tirmania nivea]
MAHDQFDVSEPWPKGLDPLMYELYTILVECDALNDFNESLKKALSAGVQELKDLNISSSSDYIWFMNDLLKWIPTENRDGTWVYIHLVVFYWIFNLPPLGTNARAQTQIIPENVGKKQKPVTTWLFNYANKMGEFLSTTDSWPPGSLETFENAKKYNVDLYQGPWTTFNDFFSRHLKTPHKVDGVGNDKVIVSPADCTYKTAMVPVDQNGDINVKGMLWNISELLSGSAYLKGSEFTGGKFVHAFLNTYDYHRQHAPVAGRVVEAKPIQGQCYLQVIEKVDPDTGIPRLMPVRPIPPPAEPNNFKDLEAPDATGYQFLQSRGIILIENDNLGLVAVLPVGMAQVSSVKTILVPGQRLNKGDEISWFEFGGSDIIMVFQKNANVRLTVNPDKSPHMLQGQQVIEADY